MRRPLAVLAAGLLVLATAPLAARALFQPSITLLDPKEGTIAVGDVTVTWSYEGFAPEAWVDVEVRRGDDPFTRVARVRIDDGTPGYRGSATWTTTAADDGTDHTVRIVVPSNKSAHDAVSPLVVDNTAPEATELDRSPAANTAGWHRDDVTVRWACTDATSGVVAPEVSAVVTGEGRGRSATATCEDLAGHTTVATAEGIDIDRTAPTTSLVATAPADGVPAPAVVADIAGSAGDALSGVAKVVVTFVDTAGAEATRTATCTGCGTDSATWTVSTKGLAPGRYTVAAVATDVADNAGTPASADFLVVAAPDAAAPDGPPDVPDVPHAPDVPGAPGAPAGDGPAPPTAPAEVEAQAEADADTGGRARVSVTVRARRA